MTQPPSFPCYGMEYSANNKCVTCEHRPECFQKYLAYLAEHNPMAKNAQQPASAKSCWGRDFTHNSLICQGCPQALTCREKYLNVPKSALLGVHPIACNGVWHNHPEIFDLPLGCKGCNQKQHCHEVYNNCSVTVLKQRQDSWLSKYGPKGENVKMVIAKNKRDKTCVYCEHAPPRCVVESAGLVYSLGLKYEAERHQEWGDQFSLQSSLMLDHLDLLVLRPPEIDIFGGKLLDGPMSQPLAGVDVLRVIKRCKLCGGWMRTKTITAENDARRKQVEVLFTSFGLSEKPNKNLDSLDKQYQDSGFFKTPVGEVTIIEDYKPNTFREDLKPELDDLGVEYMRKRVASDTQNMLDATKGCYGKYAHEAHALRVCVRCPRMVSCKSTTLGKHG